MTHQDMSARRFEIEGHDLGYPTKFHDGSSIAAIYIVNSRVAGELIAESGFEIAEIAPGRGLMTLTGVHYTDTECGAYEEMAMAFFVEKVGQRKGLRYLRTWADLLRGEIASFTWKLQVTTRLSQYAGIEMWGFPKTLESIEYEHADGAARFRLEMDGEETLSLCVATGDSYQPKPISSPVYSIFEGSQHVSWLSQSYRDSKVVLGGGELQLGSNHLAQDLRRLGLPRRALLATWNGHLAFSMTSPEKL